MPSVDAVLQEIEKRSKWEFLPIIGAAKARFLEQLVKDGKPCRTVEVGVLTGYTTITIARHLPEGCAVTGIEISDELAKRAEENVARAGLASKAVILRGDARQLLDDEISGHVDLVFLDAQKSQYLSYLKKLEPKLSPGAVVIANGTGSFQRELKSYLEYVRIPDRFQSTSEVFGDDAMEVTILKK
jgi:predicted O-methyltransferase YrrM